MVQTQLDLFAVHTIDPPLRDARDVMEFPFLSLQKGRTKPIEFSSKNVAISVAADIRTSIATVWDWDIIIFAASHLNQGIEQGLQPSPRLSFTPHDCLRQIGRGTGGKDYRDLAQAIRRLRLTNVITNLRMDDTDGGEGAFSWLVNYWIPKRYQSGVLTPSDNGGSPDPTRPWEIELPPWIYNSILRRREILAVHPDYFQLTGGLERWLYRLARKSVPDQSSVPAIPFLMQTLHNRSGSTRKLSQFAFDIRKLSQENALPEYGLRIDRDGKNELVTFYRDHGKPRRPPRGMSIKIPGNPNS
ncbi:replication initiator protein A [Camelimonas lactis]|uniref:Plasmid replication initiation protein n=1 Tax=Camelimonas lactis TaxID=659006 RepID=A0A4R2GG43_9HYPH|nr:replication initiator protein A [Camelimonas lactis]TCO07167.1 plasmid replication initiation protein [Camelimonas lactis]